MALDPSSVPCNLLNSAAFPSIWLSPTRVDIAAYYDIVDSTRVGTVISSPAQAIRPYSIALNTETTAGDSNSKPISSQSTILTSSTSSQYRLVKYLTESDSNTLGEVVLRKNGTIVTVIDSILRTLGLTNATYKYNSPPLTTANINTIISEFNTDKLLLSTNKIYNPSQFDASGNLATVTRGSESLVYLNILGDSKDLSKIEHNGINLQTAKTTLENTNMRFFAAFLCEYCYYSTRYNWLLSKYFTIYAMAANIYQPTSTDAVAAASILFGQGFPLPSTSTVASLTQADYLTGLAYQLANLNRRMKDMNAILAAINTEYATLMTTMQNAPIGKTELQDAIVALNTSSKTSASYLQAEDFSKAAMEYNLEKNRSANIMLGLYAFLNIAALAAVLQLARS